MGDFCWAQDSPGSAIRKEPWGLGSPWCLQEEPRAPPAGRLCPSRLWILPFAKAKGAAIYHPPPAPQLHAHQPLLPEDKGLQCL